MVVFISFEYTDFELVFCLAFALIQCKFARKISSKQNRNRPWNHNHISLAIIDSDRNFCFRHVSKIYKIPLRLLKQGKHFIVLCFIVLCVSFSLKINENQIFDSFILCFELFLKLWKSFVLNVCIFCIIWFIVLRKSGIVYSNPRVVLL